MQDSGIPSSWPPLPPAHAPQRAAIDYKEIFDALQLETSKMLEEQIFLRKNEVHYPLNDVFCPLKEAIMFDKIPGPWRYLHANRVALKDGNEPLVNYIAAQGPTPPAYTSFWRGVTENTNTLIDLLRPEEVKYYFPTEIDTEKKFETITVRCIARQCLGDDFEIHQYEVNDEGEKKLVTRIHFSGWKDKQGLLQGKELDKLALLLSLADALSDKQRAIMIHCRAGIGRTGTLMVASALRELHAAGKLNRENYTATIIDLIIQARTQRGPHTVQTASQLKTLYLYAEALIDGSLPQYQVIPSLFGKLLTNIRVQQIEAKTAQVSQKALQGLEERVIFDPTMRKIQEQEWMLYDYQIEEFERALDDLLSRAIAEKIPLEERDRLVVALTAIKAEAVKTSQIPESRLSGYVLFEPYAEDFEDQSEGAKLTEAQVDKINFAMNLLSTEPAPAGVMENPAYISPLMCCTLGRTGINPTEIWPGIELRDIVMKNTGHLFEAAHAVHPKECVYLLRPSTSRRGTENMRAFTLSYYNTDEVRGDIRLGYDAKQKKWVNIDLRPKLHAFTEKKRKDPAFAACVSHIKESEIGNNAFDTLDNLITFSLAWARETGQLYPLAEDLREGPCRIAWNGPELLAETGSPLLLKGISRTCLQFSDDFPQEPFILPPICWENPAVLKALLEFVFYRQPINIEDEDLPIAFMMGQALQSDQLCRRLTFEVLRKDPGYVDDNDVEKASIALKEAPQGTYFIRESKALIKNTFPIHFKLGQRILRVAITTTPNGTFRVVKVKEDDPEPPTFPSLQALLRAIGIENPIPLSKGRK